MAPHAESPLPNDATGYLSAQHAEAVKPNILFIMADQMAAPELKIHNPASVIRTPNIDKLAEKGVVFDHAYTNSPLCAPSRFCLLTGQLPSKTKGYDNASFLGSDIPTMAHYLRSEGYDTTLAGKMHFIGPDQLHGYENRLTSDIYPGDFGWAVNWDKPEERQEWFHNMSSVLQAGPAVRTNQLDYDEEVMYKSQQYLYDYVRSGEGKRPFFLTVSLTHPHDPYAIDEELWDEYEDVDIPMPKVQLNQDEQDPHSVRLMKCIDLWDNKMPEEAIKRARRAYYAACTYVDNNVGKLLNVLKKCKLDKNTIIIFSGDHGDMLGERNMWYKMSFFENSTRVPLIVHYPPLFTPKRVKESVSTMDLPTTLLDIVGGDSAKAASTDGRSIYPALLGGSVADEVFGEYMGEGTISPIYMIRRGQFKYITSMVDKPQLFDLKNDPLELNDLATSTDRTHQEVLGAFDREARDKWDFQKIHKEVLASQRQRRICWDALHNYGRWEAWDYQPPEDATKKYIRSNMELDELELRARYPPVDMRGRPLVVGQPHHLAGAKGE